ncbi:MAG: N-acetylmuramoyl-L-alanine amidase [Lachnospiraceae bacterium]|nr:N-acetylmuramoyl-L-alanine amidase [Lachnospiraceae bacterium]
MGNRREEHYRRLQMVLKWMLAVNLILVGIVVMLGVRTAVLSREVKQLAEQLETVAPDFGGGTDGESDGLSGIETDEPDESDEGSASKADQSTESTTAEDLEVNATEEESDEEQMTEEPTAEVPATEASVTEPPNEVGLRNYIVCLDAGHGGPGGKGATSPLDGRIESHDTLKLTLAVQRALESYSDITVVMTRTEDVEVDNGVRAQIANDANADLFVSFHRNSNTSGDKGGVEGWIHSSNPSDSRAAGELILAAMEKVGVTYNYGVKSGTWDEPDVNYKIIRLAEMPAVLLEVGYLNYARDNELYDQNYEAYGRATAEAIYTWLKDWVVR